jgi:putative addiction module killer protein
VIEVRQTEIFAHWLANLRDGRARARINTRIRRLSIGNPGDAKSIGGGVSEHGTTTVRATAFILSVEAKHLSS